MVTGATGLVGVPGPIAVHGVSRRSNTGERVTARFGSADARRGEAAVMYGPDLIMKAGGRVTEYRLAIADVYTLNASAPTRIWQLRSPMDNLRTDHYLVVLPDGTILAVGGEGQGTGRPV